MYFIIKRIFDILVSLFFIVFLFPWLIIISLLVFISSGWPVIYSQERVGKQGKIFKIFKFRTMVIGAENLGPGISSFNDSRITLIGKFLRKYKFDELPQFFNVLMGKMSIVGPRPELSKYVQIFKDDYSLLLTVKPGITDYASIEFKDEAKYLANVDNIEMVYLNKILPVKISLAKKYIYNSGFFVDMKIIFSTIRTIIR